MLKLVKMIFTKNGQCSNFILEMMPCSKVFNEETKYTPRSKRKGIKI